MKHRINPQIYCVFKALLGSDQNKHLLLNFLNSIVEPKSPITSVELLNPYNEKELLSDKLSIVDVKAKDEASTMYQIEIHMVAYGYLPSRILYNWSDLYSRQLESGEDYHKLQPVISIWLLAENVFLSTDIRHHRFEMADLQHQRLLNDHGSIHVLELQKWQANTTLSQKDRWALFFRNAQYWGCLPAELSLPEFIQAMATIKRFSEKERDYHLYQARQNYIREQKSQQLEYEQALASLQQEREAREKERDDNLKEQQRLKQLLLDAGINPG